MKMTNEYAAQFGRLYEKTPKAVFAAIAYSFANRLKHPNGPDEIGEFLTEWSILHENRIVPQPPGHRPQGAAA